MTDNMTEQLKQLREAFERWAPSAFSRRTTVDEDGDLSYDDDWMQGAWVAYVELTTSQPAQAGEVDERVAFVNWMTTTYPKVYREADASAYWENGHVSALAWQARASLPTQPAQAGEQWTETAAALNYYAHNGQWPTQPAAQATPAYERQDLADDRSIESPRIYQRSGFEKGMGPAQGGFKVISYQVNDITLSPAATEAARRDHQCFAEAQATPNLTCKVCQGSGDAPLVTKGESLCKACYGTGEQIEQAMSPEITRTGYTIPTPDDSFVAISFRIDDISPEPTEDFEHINCQFNGIDGTAEARRVDDNTVDIGRVVAFAQATTEPTVTYATVRDADDELHIECRFSDGQKFAAVTVAQGFDNLAHRIETMLNEAQQATQQAAGEPIGYVSPEALEELHMSGEPASIHPWRDRDDFVAVYTHPAPGVPEGWSMDREGGDVIVVQHQAVGLARATNPATSMHGQVLFALCDDILQDHKSLAAAQAKGGEHV